MANKDTVTAWLDVEYEKGTKRIVRVDMDTSDAPTISVKYARTHICTMEFPHDQANMKTPFVNTIARALAALVIIGLRGNQVGGQVVAASRPVSRFHKSLDELIPEAFAAVALEGLSGYQYARLQEYVPELRVNEELIR